MTVSIKKKRPSKKGTGQHVMSNEELKQLLLKQGLLEKKND